MFTRSRIDLGGFLDEVVTSVPRQVMPLIIFNCGIAAAVPYLLLADGELHLIRLLLVGAILPAVVFIAAILRNAYGSDYFWLWALIIYTALPAITHLFAHLCGDIFGLTALSATLHWWRWHTLWVPHAVSLVYLAGLLAWHKVRG